MKKSKDIQIQHNQQSLSDYNKKMQQSVEKQGGIMNNLSRDKLNAFP